MKGSDPVSRLAPPSIVSKTLRNLRVQTIEQLAILSVDDLVGNRGIGARRLFVLTELVNAAKVALAQGATETLPGPPPSELIRRLEARGVDPDLPWREFLPLKSSVRAGVDGTFGKTLRDLAEKIEIVRPAGWKEGAGRTPWKVAMPTVSVRVAKVLKRRKLVTLDDVLTAWQSGRLLGVRNFGRVCVAEIRLALRCHNVVVGAMKISPEIRKAMEVLARDGIQKTSDGPDVAPRVLTEPPKTAEELIARCFASLRPEVHVLFRRWMTEGQTFVRVGAGLKLPFQEARLGILRRLEYLRKRFGDDARRIGAKVLQHVDERGPMIHRLDIARLDAGMELEQTPWVLSVGGLPKMYLWRRDFAIGRRVLTMERIMEAVRAAMLKRSPGRRTLDALRRSLRTLTRMNPTDDVLEVLAREVFGVEVLPDGCVRFPKKHPRPPRVLLA